VKTSRFSDSKIMTVLKQAEARSPVPELCREAAGEKMHVLGITYAAARNQQIQSAHPCRILAALQTWDCQSRRRSLSTASKTALGWSNGAHGFRHSYAKNSLALCNAISPVKKMWRHTLCALSALCEETLLASSNQQ
jgi:hypothetical protein